MTHDTISFTQFSNVLSDFCRHRTTSAGLQLRCLRALTGPMILPDTSTQRSGRLVSKMGHASRSANSELSNYIVHVAFGGAFPAKVCFSLSPGGSLPMKFLFAFLVGLSSPFAFPLGCRAF